MSASSAELLSIGEVSRRTDLAVSAIRYYEERGLVHATARAGGRRCFDESTVTRLRVITTVQRAGFSLDEIRELLRPSPDGTAPRHTLVSAKLAQVRQDIRRLQAVAEALETALSCGCDSLVHCPLVVPDDLSRGEPTEEPEGAASATG